MRNLFSLDFSRVSRPPPPPANSHARGNYRARRPSNIRKGRPRAAAAIISRRAVFAVLRPVHLITLRPPPPPEKGLRPSSPLVARVYTRPISPDSAAPHFGELISISASASGGGGDLDDVRIQAPDLSPAKKGLQFAF